MTILKHQCGKHLKFPLKFKLLPNVVTQIIAKLSINIVVVNIGMGRREGEGTGVAHFGKWGAGVFPHLPSISQHFQTRDALQWWIISAASFELAKRVPDKTDQFIVPHKT